MHTRHYARELGSRLAEPRRFSQVVAGPRQVGKTTLVRQVLSSLGASSRYVSADEPTLRDRGWITQEWELARLSARDAGPPGVVVALDEIHKICHWSETVKRLWKDVAGPLPTEVSALLQHRG